ncbi:myogenesis-regulating glycosidase-like isoform X3 [Pomacea canaliculata]|nr:myogenesis-regulating glycosidase-like isoform X3 [Pomacea canaliculata]XP_025078517.1 myogenesis-regulating glycosidase-like isoform X3 [Pomacea canaliculata]
MFRSRNDHCKSTTGRNKDVSIPLVRDRDMEEASALKRKTSSAKDSTVDGSQAEEAVQAQESKRRKRRIMKFAVYIMFGVIALGVFAIWLFHKDAVESIRFGGNFLFTVKVRTLEIKLDNQNGLLYGELGSYLKATPFSKCWDSVAKEYEENCLFWKHMAYLRVSRDDNATSQCYTLNWRGLDSEFQAEDCFYLQKYNWYGYLLPDHQFWPISRSEVSQAPYYTKYPEEQKVNLVPSWLGSQGISIFVHSSYPFTVSWNISDKRQFCLTSELQVQEDREEGDEGLDQLTYTICQGTDLKDVYLQAQRHRQGWNVEVTKRPHMIQPLPWPILTLSSHADFPNVTTMLFENRSRCSFLELPDLWEREYGDLQFDGGHLSDLRELIKVAEARGCSVVLPISTFFTFNSVLFKEGVKNKYFLRDELNLVTKMVRWREREGAVLDTTHPNATRWYLDHLKKLLNEYNVHALKLQHIDVPRDANFKDSNMTFLDYSRLFFHDASLLLNVTLILEQATGFIGEPVFVSLRTNIHHIDDAQCFNTVIPWALTLSVSGYPLVVADASNLLQERNLTTQLFIRWFQLAMFFPAVQIPNLQLMADQDLSKKLWNLLDFRQEKVLPYMKEVWATEREAPIIRPLWWLDPKDSVAQMVSDEFLIGDKLLVAPIMCDPATGRSVYLPEGRWRGAENQDIIGPQTVHVIVKPNQIPYFWEVSEGKKLSNFGS